MTAMEPEECIRSPRPFGRGDVVRLKRDLEGVARDSQGIVLGWYVNEPGRVVVHFSDGDTRHIPTEALERAA